MKPRRLWILVLALGCGAVLLHRLKDQRSGQLPFPFGNLSDSWPGQPNYWRDDLKALGAAAVKPLVFEAHRHSFGERAWVQRLRQRVPNSLQQYLPDHGTATYRRRVAIWGLGEVGPAAAEAVPDLIALRDQTSDIAERAIAIIALAKILPDDDAARSNVVALLTSTQQTERFYAAQNFGGLPIRTPDEVRPLIAALEDSDGEVRANAAFSLGCLGPLSRAAVPQLQRLLTDSYRHVPLCAAYALVAISPEYTAAGLAVITNAPAKGVDLAEIIAQPFFRAAGPAAWPVVPWLESSLDPQGPRSGLYSPSTAALALAAITNRPGARAIQELASMSRIGLEPVQMLGRIGPVASNAVPFLKELEALTISPTFRTALREALFKITNAAVGTQP